MMQALFLESWQDPTFDPKPCKHSQTVAWHQGHHEELSQFEDRTKQRIGHQATERSARPALGVATSRHGDDHGGFLKVTQDHN